MGALVADGMPGSLIAARDAARAMKLKAEGARLAELPPQPNETVRTQFGNALIALPSDQARIENAAKLIYQGRIAPNVDPKSADEAKTLYEDALQEAAGRHVVGGQTYGGIETYRTGWFSGSVKVVVPPTIRSDRFGDVIGAIDDAMLKTLPGGAPVDAKGKLYPASDLKSAWPVRVGNGYRFAMGDPASDDPRYIRGADGRPFTLDMDALEPQLRLKVPGAFLGRAP